MLMFFAWSKTGHFQLTDAIIEKARKRSWGNGGDNNLEDGCCIQGGLQKTSTGPSDSAPTANPKRYTTTYHLLSETSHLLLG